MIRGAVNAVYEATIRLVGQDANGQPHEVEAVIDTGFTGFLSLPLALIAALGMPWLCRQQGILADGSIQVFEFTRGPLFGMACRVLWRSTPPMPSRLWA